MVTVARAREADRHGTDLQLHDRTIVRDHDQHRRSLYALYVERVPFISLPRKADVDHPSGIKSVPEVSALAFPCLNVTTSTATCTTSLEDICGFGGFGSSGPNQTFRYDSLSDLHSVPRTR